MMYTYTPFNVNMFSIVSCPFAQGINGKGILFCTMQITPEVKTERHNLGRRQGAWRSLQVPEIVFVSPYVAIFAKLVIITDGNCRKHMNDA